MTRVLSSCPPKLAKYFSLKEKDKLWIKTLCNFSLWIFCNESKSQMIMSAYEKYKT